jgi:hypothetical protein
MRTLLPASYQPGVLEFDSKDQNDVLAYDIADSVVPI